MLQPRIDFMIHLKCFILSMSDQGMCLLLNIHIAPSDFKFGSNIRLSVTSYPVFSPSLNVYFPECPLGGTIGHPGGQQKKFLLFDHGRDLVALNGTGL